jgi:hypothetical protein
MRGKRRLLELPRAQCVELASGVSCFDLIAVRLREAEGLGEERSGLLGLTDHNLCAPKTCQGRGHASLIAA